MWPSLQGLTCSVFKQWSCIWFSYKAQGKKLIRSFMYRKWGTCFLRSLIRGQSCGQSQIQGLRIELSLFYHWTWAGNHECRCSEHSWDSRPMPFAICISVIMEIPLCPEIDPQIRQLFALEKNVVSSRSFKRGLHGQIYFSLEQRLWVLFPSTGRGGL